MARPVSDFFTYQLNFLLLGANAVVTLPIVFDASSDFTWYYASYVADANSAVQTQATRVYPLVDVLITPSDTSAQFMNVAAPITSLFGNGENPFVLPAPRLIPARSTMNFTVTNRDAANTNLRLSLIGVKNWLA